MVVVVMVVVRDGRSNKSGTTAGHCAEAAGKKLSARSAKIQDPGKRAVRGVVGRSCDAKGTGKSRGGEKQWIFS
jgi:hypothetical protein